MNGLSEFGYSQNQHASDFGMLILGMVKLSPNAYIQGCMHSKSSRSRALTAILRYATLLLGPVGVLLRARRLFSAVSARDREDTAPAPLAPNLPSVQP